MRRICSGATPTSKREGVEPAVGANVEAILSRQQSLEVPQAGHGFLGTAAGMAASRYEVTAENHAGLESPKSQAAVPGN